MGSFIGDYLYECSVSGVSIAHRYGDAFYNDQAYSSSIRIVANNIPEYVMT